MSFEKDKLRDNSSQKITALCPVIVLQLDNQRWFASDPMDAVEAGS